MNAFIQQGCIKLIKHDTKDIYNATTYFKSNTFIKQRILRKVSPFPDK